MRATVMVLLPSVLRPHRFPCVLPLAALAVMTVFLTVATGVLAQERYRSPEEAVAALVDAMRSDAPGGQVDYMLSGNMVVGFALVAYPARYRSSGLMTFLVNHQGTIYKKDLGWRTTDIALEMTSLTRIALGGG